MINSKFIIFLSILSILPTNTSHAIDVSKTPPPTEVLGIALGMSVEKAVSFIEKMGFKDKALYDNFCVWAVPSKINGFQFERVIIGFEKNMVTNVELVFSEELNEVDFEKIKNALIKKYGQPSLIDTNLGNLKGMDGCIWYWSNFEYEYKLSKKEIKLIHHKSNLEADFTKF